MSYRITRLDQALSRVKAHLRNGAGDFRPGILEILGKSLDCDWGTYWEVDSVNRVLRPLIIWRSKNAAGYKLETNTKFKTLSLGEGAAGLVWRNGKPVWSVDLSRDMCLPRSLEAEEIGLKCGVWFVVRTDTAVYGVVELLGRKLEPASESILTKLETLGTKIGQKFEKQALKKSTRFTL